MRNGNLLYRDDVRQKTIQENSVKESAGMKSVLKGTFRRAGVAMVGGLAVGGTTIKSAAAAISPLPPMNHIAMGFTNVFVKGKTVLLSSDVLTSMGATVKNVWVGWGDGTATLLKLNDPTGGGFGVSHTYVLNGTYTIAALAKDNVNETSNTVAQTVQVGVINAAHYVTNGTFGFNDIFLPIVVGAAIASVIAIGTGVVISALQGTQKGEKTMDFIAAARDRILGKKQAPAL